MLRSIGGLFAIIFFASCGNIKQLQYLQGEIDTAALSRVNFTEPEIQKGDIVSITVYSDNKLASEFFNQGGAALQTVNTGTGTLSGGGSGYQVSHDGTIQLYELGKVKAEGMTKNQLSNYLAEQYREKNLLKNPYVEVRYLNFKVTLVGDLNRPGVYTLPSDKVSIFDAISLAGDLTNFARRDNILVVREVDGIRHFGRVDLSNINAFNSPYYYLQQNDMVVVDVSKLKRTVTDQSLRYVSLTASVVSVIAIIITIFR